MKILQAILILFLVAGCASKAAQDTTLQAGYRHSPYGPSFNPGNEYWPEVGKRIAAQFSAARPAAIWIVGIINAEGTYLSFPCETDDPNVTCGYVDMNEAMLTAFDKEGYAVWLQVESGNADMDKLIDIVLNQYKHHPSVVGFGVDVEWYKSTNGPEGQPITDEEATRWVRAIRKHNPDYRLFLKHWDTAWMPPTVREGIVFIDDSQQFESLDQMVETFASWGKTFAPAPVGFQYGYPADQVWWGEMQDPAKEIGQALVDKIPNTQSLFWVDFTIVETFPPQ